MHKREDHHHTPQQVGQALAQAIKIADNAELSAEDRAAALPTLITLLASKQIFYEQVAPLPDLANLGRH